MNKKYDKTDIIEKGIELFRDRGYGNTGIQDILKSCGIPKGSFYNFFDSKEAFALESISHYSKSSLEYLRTLDENADLTPQEKIKRFFIINNENLRKENCKLNCLLLSMTNEISGENNPFAGAISTNIDQMKSYITKWVTQGQTNKSIRDDISPIIITDLLYDGYHGAITRMKYQQNHNALEHFENNNMSMFFV